MGGRRPVCSTSSFFLCKYREINVGINLAFIDMDKAYDNVIMDIILRTLEARRVSCCCSSVI